MNLQETRRYQRYQASKKICNTSLNSREKIVSHAMYELRTKGPFEALRVARLNAEQNEQAVEDAKQKLQEMQDTKAIQQAIANVLEAIASDGDSDEIHQGLEDIYNRMRSIDFTEERKELLDSAFDAFKSKNLEATQKNLQILQKGLAPYEIDAAIEEMQRQLRDTEMQFEANLEAIDRICEECPDILEADYDRMQRVYSKIDLTNHTARAVAKYAIAQETGLPPDAVEGILRQAAQGDQQQAQLFLQSVQEIRNMALDFLRPMLAGSEDESEQLNGQHIYDDEEGPTLEEMEDALVGYLAPTDYQDRIRFLNKVGKRLGIQKLQ